MRDRLGPVVVLREIVAELLEEALALRADVLAWVSSSTGSVVGADAPSGAGFAFAFVFGLSLIIAPTPPPGH